MLSVNVPSARTWLLQAAGKATEAKDAGVQKKKAAPKKKAAERTTDAKKPKTAAKKQQGAKATAKKGAAKK